MARTECSIVVPGRLAEAEDLWYDTKRWPSWVDGFGHLVRVDGDWPMAGSELSWQSRPGGRGRVLERVVEHAPGVGQTVGVEDEALTGTQRVAFAPEEGETRVTLALEFELKGSSVLGPLRTFFVKRSLTESLRRTLGRFAVEREAELRL